MNKKVYDTKDILIGIASVHIERANEVKFWYFTLDKDCVETKNGVKLEGFDGLWDMIYGSKYSSNQSVFFENGSFIKRDV